MSHSDVLAIFLCQGQCFWSGCLENILSNIMLETCSQNVGHFQNLKLRSYDNKKAGEQMPAQEFGLTTVGNISRQGLTWLQAIQKSTHRVWWVGVSYDIHEEAFALLQRICFERRRSQVQPLAFLVKDQVGGDVKDLCLSPWTATASQSRQYWPCLTIWYKAVSCVYSKYNP